MSRPRVERDSLRVAAVQLDYLPNAVTPRGSHWIPSEPLAPHNPLAGPEERFALRDLAVPPELRDVLDRQQEDSAETYRANLELKLKQILEYVREASVDVVVFPEYAIPAQLVPVLQGFAGYTAVFAGLGHIRHADLPYLDSLLRKNQKVEGRNCAIYLSGGTARFVSKKHLARDEHAEKGTGVATLKLAHRGETLGVGLAICLDYLHAGPAFDDGEARLDVALISALTPELTDFIDPPPRGFARVMANHAYYGGTGVVMADFQGGAFATTRGSEPLQAGEEGIVIADIEGFNTRPSSLTARRNRLARRAALIYDTGDQSEAETVTPASLARVVAEWNRDEYLNGSYAQFLRQFTQASPQRRSPLLGACLARLERQQATAVIAEDDFDLYTKHLVCTGVLTEQEVRYKRLARFLDIFREWIHRGVEAPALGAYYDEFARVIQELAPKVARPQREPGHRYIGEVPTEEGGSDARIERFFAARLGLYDSQRAVRTLPQQLGILQNIVALSDPAVMIVYRLSTALEASGDLKPFFDVLGLVRDPTPRVLESLTEGLGQEMGVAFSSGWNVSGTSAPAVPELAWVAELALEGTPVPAISEDWAGLVDYLRTLQEPALVQLACGVATGVRKQPVLADAPELSEGAMFPSDQWTAGFLDPIDRDAAGYLQRAARETVEDGASLTLRVWVGSDSPLSEAVIQAIGSRVFGGRPFSSMLRPRMDPFATETPQLEEIERDGRR